MGSSGRIVVVGSANADLVLDVDHRPSAGETVFGSDVRVTPGGKGANQAVAAGRLGGDVTFVGCVGDDDHGAMLRRSLEAAGVDVGHLRTVGAPTGNAVILLTPDGENAIIASPGANRHVTPALLTGSRAALASADVVVVQLEIPLDTVEQVAREARSARVVVNAAPAATLPPEVLAVADPLVVNESEAAVLLGEAHHGMVPAGSGPAGTIPAGSGPAATVTALLALGPRSVVVTLGGAGAAHAVAGGRTEHTRARPVDVVDTTGAGDAFVGALALELARGADLGDAVVAATGVAAFAVGRRGAQESYPHPHQLSG
ncbi:ribokinase [Georgenia muralis]|uniref:Ribokinase n=1 Tax=Georgenia muralis TaxID=154117 RepID=A0A3N4Z6T8_9MICO|nr:ribokinase [Georgenia muralis]RPF29129.1 ribokinase [Georgenia muralis]